MQKGAWPDIEESGSGRARNRKSLIISNIFVTGDYCADFLYILRLHDIGVKNAERVETPKDSETSMLPASVLTTVNAPHSKQLDADALAHCLVNPLAAQASPGHMSAFFGEVEPELQIAFAQAFNISKTKLVVAAKLFAAYSGEHYPLAA